MSQLFINLDIEHFRPDPLINGDAAYSFIPQFSNSVKFKALQLSSNVPIIQLIPYHGISIYICMPVLFISNSSQKMSVAV